MVKRFFDLVFATLILVVMSPFLLILALVMTLKYRSSILFLQKRLGRNGKLFTIVKLRTIYQEDGFIDTFSEKLRLYGIDELPQLWNVIRGEMSLVGPRPLLPEALSYLAYHGLIDRQKVLPGITGLSQISGRNALRWEEKFRLDIHYATNLSIILDVKIIVRTFRALCNPKKYKLDKHFSEMGPVI